MEWSMPHLADRSMEEWSELSRSRAHTPKECMQYPQILRGSREFVVLRIKPDWTVRDFGWTLPDCWQQWPMDLLRKGNRWETIAKCFAGRRLMQHISRHVRRSWWYTVYHHRSKLSFPAAFCQLRLCMFDQIEKTRYLPEAGIRWKKCCLPHWWRKSPEHWIIDQQKTRRYHSD